MSSITNRRAAANDSSAVGAGTASGPSSVSDLYARVTASVIASLEAGVPPWVCPWTRTGAGITGSQLPVNATTGRPYRGINVLLLNARLWECGFTSNRWLTFNQAQSLGARVRKGSTGSTVVFFKMWEAGDSVGPSSSISDIPAIDDRKVIPLLRSFTVFNADQVDGLPEGMASAPVPDADGTPGSVWDPISSAEALVAASGASVAHGGERAFYRPADDHIQMPVRSAFASSEAYYSTLLHELTHWTGHDSRCARPLQGRAHIEAYAFEELVAEMGSAFLCGHCGLLPAAGGEAPGLQHAAYIDSWLQALRNDRRLVFTASSLAQKAADFVLAQVASPVAHFAPEVA